MKTLLSTCLILSTLSIVGKAVEPVTLKVERPSGPGKWGDMRIEANGKYLGSIADGKTATFYFESTSTTVNDLKIYWHIGSDQKQVRVGNGGEVCMVVDGGNVRIEDVRVTKAGEGLLVIPVSADVVLDKELKRVVVKKSPTITLPKGGEKTIEDSVSVAHVVNTSDKWTTDGETKAKVSAGWLSVSAGIRASVEKMTSKSYSTETNRKRSVTIRGDGASEYKVIWVEYYRTGTATFLMEGKPVKMPFELKDDFDLLLEDQLQGKATN